MKLCLFALTGFGNNILNELIKVFFINNILVFTRKEKGKFPYYDCNHISEICVKRNIKVYLDQRLSSEESYNKIVKFSPDMILIATFDQKIPEKIVDIPKMGVINIHPSLLPAYRGSTPTHWAIINGENETGITFHFVVEDFDMGDILLQKKVSIDGLIDGELRKKLANIAGETVGTFLRAYINNEFKPKIQSKNEGSYYPKVTSQQGIAMLKSGQYSRNNLIRGLTPFPGIGILG